MAKRNIQRDALIYYVYQIKIDGVVRYIGKGTRYRIKRHLQTANGLNRRRDSGEHPKALKFHNRLAKAIRNGSDVVSSFIVTGLTNSDALEREISEIASFPEGQLWNETAGGDGVDSITAKKYWLRPEYREKRLAFMRSDDFRERARNKTIAQFSSQEVRDTSSKKMKGVWLDPQFRERMTKAVGKRWDDPEFREKHRVSTMRHWDEFPERRAARAEITRAYASEPEFRENAGKRFKKFWKDPEFRKRAMAHWNDPVRKKAIVDGLTPEFLKERGKAISEGLLKSEKMRALHKDPIHRAKVAAAVRKYWSGDEAKLRQSAKMKQLWADPEHRAKTTAHWEQKRKAKNDRS